MSSKLIKTTLQYILFFGLGFALIYWQYTKLTDQNKAEMLIAWNQVKEKTWLLIPVIIIGFLSHFFRALRWRVMLEPLKINVSVFNATCAVLVGYITNLLLPRMGEVAKCTVLAKYEDKPVDKIIGTIVAERAFDMVCLIVISLLTFVIQIDIVGGYLAELGKKIESKDLSLFVGGGIAFLVLITGLSVFLYRKNKSNKVGAFLKGIGDGLKAILKMEKKGLFLLYTLLIWGAYLSLVYIGFLCFEATLHLGFGAALSVLVFGSLGMIVTPGGIGAYPIAVQGVLLALYGIPGSYGLAYGWISWMAQTAIIILFGLLSFLVLPLSKKKQDGQTTLADKQAIS